MRNKYKEIGIVLNENGTCEHYVIVKSANDNEITRLKVEAQNNKEKELEEKEELLDRINKLTLRLERLEEEVRYLKGIELITETEENEEATENVIDENTEQEEIVEGENENE